MVTYDGLCERFIVEPGSRELDIDAAMSQQAASSSTPIWTPRMGSFSLPRQRFKQLMFMHPQTGVCPHVQPLAPAPARTMLSRCCSTCQAQQRWLPYADLHAGDLLLQVTCTHECA